MLAVGILDGKCRSYHATVEATDWYRWHDIYREPDQETIKRVSAIAGHVHSFLDHAPPRPLRLASICAGQAAELLPALASHSRGTDVEVHLLETDPRNARSASGSSSKLGLEHINVHVADAGCSESYRSVPRVDLVLLSGVFSNLRDSDIRSLVRWLPCLCLPRAVVVWTRHRNAPDLVPAISQWFADEDFEAVALTPPEDGAAIAAHRYAGTGSDVRHGRRIFDFVGRRCLESGISAPPRPP